MTVASPVWTPERLRAFEDRVAEAFKARQIHAPVHLSGGNETQVIEAFKHVRDQDWVFSTWRSHYHALLKGVPDDRLYQAIIEGRSMYYQDAEHKFVSSAIVGGILPIAVGVALAAKRRGFDETVWCFIGDMAASTGIAMEALRYAAGHDLPLRVVIEDNGLSTNTPTVDVWGKSAKALLQTQYPMVIRYQYTRTVPHVGIGSWVTFG